MKKIELNKKVEIFGAITILFIGSMGILFLVFSDNLNKEKDLTTETIPQTQAVQPIESGRYNEWYTDDSGNTIVSNTAPERCIIHFSQRAKAVDIRGGWVLVSYLAPNKHRFKKECLHYTLFLVRYSEFINWSNRFINQFQNQRDKNYLTIKAMELQK